MKKSIINIIALLILTSLFVGGIYNASSWFKLQNKIEQTNQKSEERDKLGKEYNIKIKKIYDLAITDLDSSFSLIRQTRRQHPKKENDLDYVEARILLTHKQKEKAEILIEKLKRNSNFESPRFSELYAYLQIEKGEIAIAERHLSNAAQINNDYKYQLANLYELKSEFGKAIELYDQMIAEDSTNKTLAKKRKMIIEKQKPNRMTNIELRDDSNRKHFSIGKLNIN